MSTKSSLSFFALIIFFATLLGFSLSQAQINRNHALILDGIDDYITVPDTMELRLANGSFSFCAWIYLESYDTYNAPIVYKRIGIPPNGYLFTVGGTDLGRPRKFYYQVNGGATPIVSSNQEIPLCEWTHVAMVHHADTKVAEVYINGVLDNSLPNILTPGASNDIDLYIGQDSIPDNPTGNFHGMVDEIQFWSRALTSREINAFKRKHLSGKEEGLIGYWDFKHGEIADHSILSQETIAGGGTVAMPENIPHILIKPAVSLIATNCLPTSEYELQYSLNLTYWNAVTREYRPIGGGTRIYSDPIIDPKRFYRLVPIEEE